MKKSIYRGTYRLVSWLSDKTGGAPFLVRWKVALAVVVLGISTSSLVGCEPGGGEVTCYEPVPPEVMCYDPVAPPEDENGNGEEGTGENGEGRTGGGGEEEEGVMCYAPVAPPEEGQQ
jgi:hypothetical protein